MGAVLKRPLAAFGDFSRRLLAALRDPERWRRWLFEFLAILAVVGAVAVWQNRDLPDGPAPPLAGVRTDGTAIKVGAGGTAQLVVFWGSWCPVCRAEEDNIEAIAADWPVISVAMQSGDAATVAQYLQARGLGVVALVDENGALAAGWRVRATPTHFILDPAGHIRFRVVGYATAWGLRLRLWWAQRLAGVPSAAGIE